MSGMQLPSTKPTAKYYAFCVAFASSLLMFLAARAPEVISMSITSPLQGMSAAVSLIATLSLFIVPPVLLSSLMRRIGLIGLVVYSLKSEMDPALKNLAAVKDLTGSICIVTGANSGTGYGITQLLVERGATVVMACRSVKKCINASQQINEDVHKKKGNVPSLTGTMDVMQLDLGDLASIKNFATEFGEKYSRIDVLVNNAGLISPSGFRTTQGLEISIGVMHIGHFALTNWLLPLLLKPLPLTEDTAHPFQNSARVVNVGSHAYTFAHFDESLMVGNTGLGDFSGELTDNCVNYGPFNFFNCCPLHQCPVTNGYARAKLANILHIHELQRHLDEDALQLVRDGGEAPRRVVTSVLHPGTVATDIHWSMHALAKLMRSKEEAAYVILHAIQSDQYLPGSYIDCMGRPHDLQGYRENHLPVHIKAFPDVKDLGLPFLRPPAIDIFSLDLYFFKSKSLIASVSKRDLHFPTSAVAARLWNASEHIVNSWEKDTSI